VENNHICPKCGFYINNSIDKHINYCKGKGPRRRIKRREGGQKWLLGKSYDELYGTEKSKEIREKISNNLIGKPTGICSTEERELERRKKISEKIIERYKNGWEVKCGRCKKIDYYSDIAGDIKVDGNWELEVAKFLCRRLE
jgi:hypothetical protein